MILFGQMLVNIAYMEHNICCTGLVQGGATEIVNAKLVNISFMDQWIMDLGLLSKTS